MDRHHCEAVSISIRTVAFWSRKMIMRLAVQPLLSSHLLMLYDQPPWAMLATLPHLRSVVAVPSRFDTARHTRNCRPSLRYAAYRGLREVINTSAVDAVSEAPSIAVSIAAALRSACANSFKTITSICADTITDLDDVIAPLPVHSCGFGIPTVVLVVSSSPDSLAALSQSERMGHENCPTKRRFCPTRRQTVETTPPKFNVDGAMNEDRKDE
ncbi:hypothetical protein R3P38DRAFT_3185224 [Favolaschia claudopus]|uniref:Uncharacterized protein n=1 Tax=Favolaschia claudopus TaxID=2862362 RepID=A0AAW0C475_9AGAR